MTKQLHTTSSTSFLVYLVLFVLSCLSLFFYSLTQVDLNLTLTRINLAFAVQDFFQHIGYFERPLSAMWYSITGIVWVIVYSVGLWLSVKKQWSVRMIWILVGLMVGILWVSYPAFSYDIYNYMFDARIITLYHENPYIHKALDYPQDPWINFMRWTHRVYPYGPVWLILTVPLSYLGFGVVIPTLLLFKSLAVIFYLIAVRCVVSIMKIVQMKKATLGILAFALNPLVVIESLVSAHNDIVMMALGLASLLLLLKKRWIWAIVVLSLSIGIKFATVFILPVYILVIVGQLRGYKISGEKVTLLCALFMIGAVGAATYRTQFQPWYLLYVLPFAALVSYKRYIVGPIIILTTAGLAQYVPFLYTGNWDPPIPDILNGIMLTGVAVSLLTSSILFALSKQR